MIYSCPIVCPLQFQQVISLHLYIHCSFSRGSLYINTCLLQFQQGIFFIPAYASEFKQGISRYDDCFIRFCFLSTRQVWGRSWVTRCCKMLRSFLYTFVQHSLCSKMPECLPHTCQAADIDKKSCSQGLDTC